MRIERVLLSVAVMLATVSLSSIPVSAQFTIPYLSNEKLDMATEAAIDTLGGEVILVGIATAGEIDLGIGVYPGFNLDDGTSNAWGYQFLTPSGDEGMGIGIIHFVNDFHQIQYQPGNDFGLEPRALDLSGAYSNSDAFVAQLKTNATFAGYLQDYPDAVPEGIALTWEPDGQDFIPEEFPLDKPIWGIYFNTNVQTPDDSTMVCFVASGTGETHCIRGDVSGVEDEEESSSIRLTVAPNPARESGIATLHIGLREEKGAVHEVGLYDAVGRKVLDLTDALVPDGADAWRTEFGLGDLSSGVYVCRVVQGTQVRSVRLIVE